MKFPLALLPTVAAALLLMIVGFSFPGALSIPHRVDGTAMSRKLQEDSFDHYPEKKSNAGNLDLEDYHQIDPSPSSKASIKPGPIEHGTPLFPYIPQPPPAGPPEEG